MPRKKFSIAPHPLLFDEIATLVCAKHIMDDVGGVIPVESPIETAPFGGDPTFDGEVYSIVFDGETPIGALRFSEIHHANRISLKEVLENAVTDLQSDPVDMTDLEVDLASIEFVPFPSDELPPTIREKMRALQPGDVIGPDMPYCTCVDLIAENCERVLVVMQGDLVHGTVDYNDLFKPMGRLCLLALAQDFETALNDLLLDVRGFSKGAIQRDFATNPDLRDVLEHVLDRFIRKFFENHPDVSSEAVKDEIFRKRGRDDARIKKAVQKGEMTDDQEKKEKSWAKIAMRRRVFEILKRAKLSKHLWSYLISSMYLSEKQRIAVSRILPEGSGYQIGERELKNVFQKIESLRNGSAHPTGFEGTRVSWMPGPEIGSTDFPIFYRDTRRVIETIRSQFAVPPEGSPRFFQQRPGDLTEPSL